MRGKSKFDGPNDLVFPTLRGLEDNRQNVRRRLLLPAVTDANVKLTEQGIEPIGSMGLHGLRRTFASLRCLAGDDPAYTAAQLGHTDALFTLKTYTAALKRREKLTPAERKAFDTAVDGHEMGTNVATEADDPRTAKASGHEKSPVSGASSDGRYWARTSDPQLVELVLSQLS